MRGAKKSPAEAGPVFYSRANFPRSTLARTRREPFPARRAMKHPTSWFLGGDYLSRFPWVRLSRLLTCDLLQLSLAACRFDQVPVLAVVPFPARQGIGQDRGTNRQRHNAPWHSGPLAAPRRRYGVGRGCHGDRYGCRRKPPARPPGFPLARTVETFASPTSSIEKIGHFLPPATACGFASCGTRVAASLINAARGSASSCSVNGSA